MTTLHNSRSKHHILILNIVFALLLILSACNSGPGNPSSSSAENNSADSSPEPTAVTESTPVPLTEEENLYFSAMYSIRDRYDTGLLTNEMLQEELVAIQPLEAMAAAHTEIIENNAAVLETFAQVETATIILLKDILNPCDTNSLTFSTCIDEHNQNTENSQIILDQFEQDKENFTTAWESAQADWEVYYQEHGYGIVQPYTQPEFSLDSEAVPVGSAGTSYFDLEVTVLETNLDATELILAESDNADAPAEGSHYILAEVQITNSSEAIVRIQSSKHFTLLTPSGTIDPLYETLPGKLESTTLQPGESLSGTLGFEVEDVQTDFLLVFLKGDLLLALQ